MQKIPMQKKKSSGITVADVLLITLTVSLSVYYFFYPPVISEGNFLNVYIRSSVKKSALSLNKNQTIKVEGTPGYCIFEISEKKIRVIESTCPDKLCIKQGWIAKGGQSIICLPSKIIAEIKGSDVDVSIR